MSLDRRRFIQITAVGMIAGLTESACKVSADDTTLTHPAVLEMLGPERTREIGKAYLAAAPKENTRAALQAAISRRQRRTIPLLGKPSIEGQVHDDFAAGRVVVVSGWVLSETEARQCALYALSV
jgi:hypothetical protein